MEMRIPVKIKLVHPDAKPPAYGRPGDAGLDICAVEDTILSPNEQKIVRSGLAFSLPPGTVGLLWDRSGMAGKNGIKTMGGVIDHTYRGEVGIVLVNVTKHEYHIKKGDRIAQLLVQPIYTAEVSVVDELEDTHRGAGGFGSSGR